MKKEYKSPTAEIFPIAKEDVIMTSSGRDYNGEWDTEW